MPLHITGVLERLRRRPQNACPENYAHGLSTNERAESMNDDTETRELLKMCLRACHVLHGLRVYQPRARTTDDLAAMIEAHLDREGATNEGK